jgi:anti-sigma factor RsiW
MDHSELRRLEDAYLDGELDPAGRAEVEAHLAGCADCRAELAERRRFALSLKAALPYHEAPADLVRRLSAELAASQPVSDRLIVDRRIAGRHLATRQARRANWRAPALAASFLLALAIGGGGGYLAALPGAVQLAESDRMTEAVVDSHIRSLLAGHLTDVVSSDQHTVKPWFDGRVDIAPPVKDFAAEGFPLVGGRLDYLDHRQVAALVYRHGRHPINLFVWAQSSEPPGLPAATSRQGYNIRHWIEGDLSFWLVSDTESEALAELESLLRRPG